ncbi:MAG: arginase, partial [Chloroflexota bacterium]
MKRPLEKLQVVGIRYRRTQPAPNDERSLDAYANANVYARVGVPIDIVEPQMIEAQRVENEPANL